MDRIVIDEMMERVKEHWRLKFIAELNGQEVKVVRIKGEFPWHHHADVDRRTPSFMAVPPDGAGH